ncbi:MAG: hypothetical protein ACI4AA_05935 [Lachnospiraceae bacterium]
MKKGTKRIIAAILALVLVVGLMPNMGFVVKAEQTSTPIGTTSENNLDNPEPEDGSDTTGTDDLNTAPVALFSTAPETSTGELVIDSSIMEGDAVVFEIGDDFDFTDISSIRVESGYEVAFFKNCPSTITINLASDATLTIIMDEQFAGTIAPVTGSKIMFGSDESRPLDMHLYYEDDDANLTEVDEGIAWTVFTYNGTNWTVPTPPPSGRPEIKDEEKKYIYAYNGINNDDDIKSRLARELYVRFIEVPMFDRFGLDTENERDNYANDEERRQAQIDILKERITVGSAGNITAKAADGSDVPIDKYRATIEWGVNMDNYDEPIVGEVYVYVLPSAKDFLVCTDFNYDTGEGTTYYLRNAETDRTSFSQDPSDEGILILSGNYSNVVAGGNGSYTTFKNVDGMKSFDFTPRSDIWPGVDNGATVRILNPADAYVAIHGEGEDKKVDGMGLNGYSYDTIWSAKTGNEATLYIGYSSINIEPINNIGVSTYTLSDVRLKDDKQKDGVTIDKSDLSKVKVSFKSNFYDSVPLIITYSDGTEVELTISRIGLVIQYWYLFGDPWVDNGNNDLMSISYDCKPDTCSFNYNYFSGEQILIYATYYHPSTDNTASGSNDLYLDIKYDDGNHEIIHHTDSAHAFNGYSPATADAVATTSFILGFVPAKEFDANVNAWTTDLDVTKFKNKFGHEGGFSATVINAGFNGDTTYGGTQVGSGAGVYWDGQIRWYD